MEFCPECGSMLLPTEDNDLKCSCGYTKKLSEAQNKESKELAKLYKEIGNYAKEFQETTDTDKKNKLAQKYAGKAREYNEIVRNSTTSSYTEVGVDLNG